MSNDVKLEPRPDRPEKDRATSEELIAALAALYAVVVWIGFIVSFALFSIVSFFLSFSRTRGFLCQE